MMAKVRVSVSVKEVRLDFPFPRRDVGVFQELTAGAVQEQNRKLSQKKGRAHQHERSHTNSSKHGLAFWGKPEYNRNIV